MLQYFNYFLYNILNLREKILLVSKFNNFSKIIAQYRFNWLALLPIVFLQLSIITHQCEDYEVNHNEDSCHICTQLERIDDNPFSEPVHFSLPQLNGLINLEKSSTLEQTALSYSFRSRAPPHI